MKRPCSMPISLRLLLAAALLHAVAPAAFGGGVETNCDIQRGPCIRMTGGGMVVEFDIKPKPVTQMSDLMYIVTVTRGGMPLTGSSAALDLTMPGMYMGKNWPVLKRVSAGRFEGNGVIPRCPTGKRTWQADVIVSHDGKTAVASFVFEVK